MPTPPDLSREAIRACLNLHYGLHVILVEFLPLGADAGSAVFRIHPRNATTAFLKLRSGNFEPLATAVPDFLHYEKGITAVMAPLPTLE